MPSQDADDASPTINEQQGKSNVMRDHHSSRTSPPFSRLKLQACCLLDSAFSLSMSRGGLSFVYVHRFDEAYTAGLSALHRRVANALRMCVDCVSNDLLGGTSYGNQHHDQYVSSGSSSSCTTTALVAAFAPSSQQVGAAEVPVAFTRKRGRVEGPSSLSSLNTSWELVGLLAGRELSSAMRAHCSPTASRSESLQRWASENTEVGDVQCTGVIAGVQLVWVAEEWWRLGVATSLVDAFRKNLVYGTVTPVQQVAFSQPTKMGKLFAQRYTSRRDFLVFE